MSKDIVLGIGDYILTDEIDATVKVFALGSCIALMLYAPIHKYLAMVHIMTPRTVPGTTIAHDNRGIYADAAVPWLVEEFFKKTGSQTICQAGIVGGAKGVSNLELLAIGEKNYTSVMKCLSEYNILPVFQDVGGRYIRNVYTEINTGLVKVQRRPFQRIGRMNNLEQVADDRSFNALYHLGKAVPVEM